MLLAMNPRISFAFPAPSCLLIFTLLFLGSFSLAAQASEAVQVKADEELSSLQWITGVSSTFHEKSGLEFRILEADGSASVAMNPVSLFLVITNNGTGDYVGQTWRLPFTVAPGMKERPAVQIAPKGDSAITIKGKLESVDADGNVQPGKEAVWQVNYQYRPNDGDPDLAPVITVAMVSSK